jgi:hypothetical protein
MAPYVVLKLFLFTLHPHTGRQEEIPCTTFEAVASISRVEIGAYVNNNM